MVHVCAWCEKFLGVKEPADTSKVTHGICDACFAIQTSELFAPASTLVLSQSRRDLLPLLQHALRDKPEIHVVLDRRSTLQAWAGPLPERRHGSTLVLV